MQDFLDDLDQLYSRTRNFEHNGYKFLLEVTDPYGFWNIRAMGMKKQPEVFEQQFTTIVDAQRACRLWAESQGSIPATEKVEESPIEPIRYKKPRVQK